MFATDNNLVLLPTLTESCEDSVWEKLYIVLMKMAANSDTKSSVKSSYIRYELDGLKIELWRSFITVQVKGGPQQQLSNPEPMRNRFEEYIKQLNAEAVENALDDFLASL
tara:strand:+ start:246 stop:575 length:330 start_codon:yes stop_codon:yes gene_type:complete